MDPHAAMPVLEIPEALHRIEPQVIVHMIAMVELMLMQRRKPSSLHGNPNSELLNYYRPLHELGNYCRSVR